VNRDQTDRTRKIVLTRSSIRALVLFVIALAAMETAYALSDETLPIVALTDGTARIVAMILGLFGEAVRLDGTVIYSPVFNIRIAAECTAITPTIVLTAAVLAFPARWSERARGLLIGSGSLFVVNLVRIVSLYYIGAANRDLVDFAHLVVWQGALVVLAIGVWVWWANGVRVRVAV
jgi:exosortase H (IPTLxxWG-CTERM-specific)